VVVYLLYCHHHQDEWICIALLFAITQQFPDTIVQLHDSDGEVLLIEAALDLPKWLEPDTSDDRIFVANGKLQVALACSCGVSVVEIISIVFTILTHKRTHTSTHTHTQFVCAQQIISLPFKAPGCTKGSRLYPKIPIFCQQSPNFCGEVPLIHERPECNTQIMPLFSASPIYIRSKVDNV